MLNYLCLLAAVVSAQNDRANWMVVYTLCVMCVKEPGLLL